MKKYRRRGKVCRAMFYDGNNALEIIKWLRGYGYLVNEYVNSQFPQYRFLRMVGADDIASKRWIVVERYRGKAQPWKIHYWTTDVFNSIYKESQP